MSSLRLHRIYQDLEDVELLGEFLRSLGILKDTWRDRLQAQFGEVLNLFTSNAN